MDTSKFLNSLRKIIQEEIRTVIKQELTDILKEGLKPTINEMTTTQRNTKPVNINNRQTKTVNTQRKVNFSENRWADILNETQPLLEKAGSVESYAELMNESMDELRFTSSDVPGFGMIRQSNTIPSTMQDPETGKEYEVKPEIAAAMTRDYSELMKAIAAKKGN